MAYRYKNISGSDQVIIGLGIIKADEEFTITRVVENPNLELINEDVDMTQQSVSGTEASQSQGITTPEQLGEIEQNQNKGDES